MPKKRKPMNEVQVLKKLGIDNFRQMSKDKIMEFCGMLDGMDPEVAKEAIAQFPNFASTAKEALLECQVTIREAISSSNASNDRYYDSCEAIIKGLLAMLDDRDLTFDEKKYVIEQMRQVEENMSRKDTEHKRHIEKIVGIASACAAVMFVTMTAVLGGKVEIGLPKQLEDIPA